MTGPTRTPRLLVVLPNWVGDVVLATPTLRALRAGLPDWHITHLMRPYVQDVLHPPAWCDDVVLWPAAEANVAAHLGLIRRLQRPACDAAVLMTNSFRSALLVRLAGVRRRIGYARDYRSWMLTDPLPVPRAGRRPAIESMIDYYARLAAALGCGVQNPALELSTDCDSQAEVRRWLAEHNAGPSDTVIVLNPGAKFGASKLYPAERFAEVGSALAARRGARIFITAGPGEHDIAERVRGHMTEPSVVLAPPLLNLRTLKALIARADLLITNDTGPRHFAIAFGVPVVTLFGPTHPGWTETHFPLESKIMVPVDCGPCQLPRCPLDHRCMTGITAGMVIDAACRLLDRGAARAPAAPAPAAQARAAPAGARTGARPA